MKKLESLENFHSNKLNETHCSNILGGGPVVGSGSGGNATQGGTRCTDKTSTGCQAYTSDESLGAFTSFFGTSEVTLEC